MFQTCKSKKGANYHIIIELQETSGKCDENFRIKTYLTI